MTQPRTYPSRFPWKPLSRRYVLQGLARSGLGLVSITTIPACSGKKEPAVVPAAEQPGRGGALRYPAFGTNPPYARGLDPHVNPTSYAGRMLLFYQTLVRTNPRTGEVEPELAQTWEQPSPTELVFSLTPGVKWHNKPPADGRSLTADDVVFSLERIRTPTPTFLSRSLLDSVDRIEAVGRSRLRLALKHVDASVLTNLTGQTMAVLAPEVVQYAGDKFVDADTAVGTGPFLLTEKTDVSATHVRNPEYWKPGLPYVDHVVTPAFGDLQAKWAAFLAGRLDIALPVPGIVASRYSGQRGQFTIDGRFPAEWAATPGALRLFFNSTRPPFGDLRVYKALRLLIDHQEVVKVAIEPTDGRGSYSQAFPPTLAQWDFSEDEYTTRFLEWKRPKDEAAKMALDMLSAAGFTRDNPLRLTLSSLSTERFDTGSQILQDQWRRLSQGVVQAEIKLFPSAVFDQVTARREYEVLHRGASPPVDEPDAVLRLLHYSGASRNYAQWSDPKADALIDRQRAILNGEQRKAVIKELLLYFLESAPTVVLGGQYSLMAAQPKVKGWAPEGDFSVFGFQYEAVWLGA